MINNFLKRKSFIISSSQKKYFSTPNYKNKITYPLYQNCYHSQLQDNTSITENYKSSETRSCAEKKQHLNFVV